MSTTVIFGPMFAGKTVEMMKRIKRDAFAGRSCVVAKFSEDTRYEVGEIIRSHDGHDLTDLKNDREGTVEADAKLMPRGNIRVVCCRLLSELDPSDEENVIGIDEGQFYPDVVEMVDKWANEGKTVYVSALDGDDRRNAFGRILELIPRSENVVKLSAVCRICGGNASFSKCLVKKIETKLIGGSDKYIAVCRKCFNK